MPNSVTRYLFVNRVVPLNEINGVETVVSGKTNALLDAGTILAEGGTLGGSTSVNDHTHPNKYLLDGLSVDSENLMQYYNSKISIPLLQEDW